MIYLSCLPSSMAGSLIVRAKLNGSSGKQAINIYILLRLSPLWVDLHFLLLYSEARSCCERRKRNREVPFSALCFSKADLSLSNL